MCNEYNCVLNSKSQKILNNCFLFLLLKKVFYICSVIVV